MSSLALVQLNVFCFDTRTIPAKTVVWKAVEVNEKADGDSKKTFKEKPHKKRRCLENKRWKVWFRDVLAERRMLVGRRLIAPGHLGLSCTRQPRAYI